MAKKQDSVTIVSDRCARVEFDVSGKVKVVDGKVIAIAVPEISYEMEVTYENDREMLLTAVPSSTIGLQNWLRTYYRENKRHAFPAGTRIKVKASGTPRVAPSAAITQLEKRVEAGETLELTEKIRLVKLAGLEPPKEWLDELAKQMARNVVTETQAMPEQEDTAKYPEGSLDKLPIAKLRVIAQDEQLEGYDELTVQELREELYLIEKE